MTENGQIKHGDPHAYNTCRLRPEGACDDCKQGHAGYVEEWREKRKQDNPDAWRKHLDQQSARRRAHRELERAHPEEYLRLFGEALRDINEARRSP